MAARPIYYGCIPKKYPPGYEQALGLQDENQKIRAELDRPRSTTFHHSVDWRVLPDGGQDGPFCPVCAGDGVEMRLVLRRVVDQTGPLLHFECPKSHLAGIGIEGYRGRGRELTYAIPKELIVSDRYFVRS
jgi:hypothetical protein